MTQFKFLGQLSMFIYKAQLKQS